MAPTTPRDVLVAAKAITRHSDECAHTAIREAQPDRQTGDECLRHFAAVVGIEPYCSLNQIWRWWDDATVEARAAAFDRAIARARGDAL